jgi:hypothetical protein
LQKLQEAGIYLLRLFFFGKKGLDNLLSLIFYRLRVNSKAVLTLTIKLLVMAQESPYVFQSGPYKDLSVEQVFLLDPIHLAWLYQNFFKNKRLIKSPNQLQLAIESLLEKIHGIDTTKDCPYCRQAKVVNFLLPDFGPVTNGLLCCDNPVCREELKSVRAGELHTISDFLLLVSYMPKPQAQKIVGIFKATHKKYKEAFA